MKRIMEIEKSILNKLEQGNKLLAVLIDPDSAELDSLLERIDLSVAGGVDLLFVGGSLLTEDQLDQTITRIKSNCNLPVIIFPGNISQINKKADGILFLSLISGRNPELLIGNHVLAAPILKNSNLEVLSTGYLLIGNDNHTTASYISNTNPIPGDKPEIAATTALAGELLGMHFIYLDAGSGAKNRISDQLIQQVRDSVSVPLIVGGGIDNAEKAKSAYDSGADIIVVGNSLEKDPEFILDLCRIKKEFSASRLTS